MHSCPECGQACYCAGDLDDAQVVTERWAFLNCRQGHGAECGCTELDGSDARNDNDEDMSYEEWLERQAPGGAG